jgi:mycothiol system anti-sigma-R factor
MDCQRVRIAMYRVRDNELEPDLVAGFTEHLASCSDCAERFSFVGKLLSLIRERCCRYNAPSTLKIRILASLPHRGGARQELVD